MATLKAFLEARGVSCACIDANAEAQEWLLTSERLDAAGELLSHGRRSPRVQRLVRAWPTLRRQLPRLKRQLRSPEGYADFNRYRTATTSLNRAMALVAAAHQAEQDSPITATLTDYLDGRVCDMASASVIASTETPQQNLFYDYYAQELIPRVRRLKPDVVGISFIFRNQLLCGAVLAAMLKDALPGAHVTLGGELVSAWADMLEDTHLPELADSIIPYEGEYPLLELARVMAEGGGEGLEQVPNLHWRDERGVFRRNATRKPQTLGELPTPDYSWAPWDLYFAPERTAPLVTARGCYWNRCTFCPEVVNPETKLRLARVEQVCADMDRVHETEGVETFHFIDSAMPPRTLKGIAEHVIENRRPYRWYGFSRLEPHLFRPGWAAHLAAGGCRMLKLGLETASQRLLDVMDKKQDTGDVSRVLRSLRDAGVMVHGFLMFGTPFEEAADAEQTHRFVRDHADCVQFLNCSLMNLAKGSPMALDPAAHGITRVLPFEIPGHTLDLALYDNFEGVGWGRLEARRFLHRDFLKEPAIRASQIRTPAHYDSNHSVFFHRLIFSGDEAGSATARRV